MIAALILLAQGQLPAAAAGGVIDQGVLVIRADTQEVARETFRLLERRVGENTDGWLLDASARWGGARGGRPAVYSPVLEVGGDSSTLALSFGVSGGPDGGASRCATSVRAWSGRASCRGIPKAW